MTVTDADGATATASVTITVTTKPPPVVETALDTNRPTLYQFRTAGLQVTVTCGSDADGPRGADAAGRRDATMERLDLDERRIGREALTCAPGRVIQLRMFPSAELERALKREKPAGSRSRSCSHPPVGRDARDDRHDPPLRPARAFPAAVASSDGRRGVRRPASRPAEMCPLQPMQREEQ